MLSLDGAGKVLHASSFSKTVSPGVRVGYLAGRAGADRDPGQARGRDATSRRTCWPSRSCSRSASRAASSENVEFVNAALRERRDVLVESLSEHIPEADFVVPEGGYFLWLTLDDDVDTRSCWRPRRRRASPFVAGPDFLIEGGLNALRLSFASVPAGPGRRGCRAHRAGARRRSRRRLTARSVPGRGSGRCMPYFTFSTVLV